MKTAVSARRRDGEGDSGDVSDRRWPSNPARVGVKDPAAVPGDVPVTAAAVVVAAAIAAACPKACPPAP